MKIFGKQPSWSICDKDKNLEGNYVSLKVAEEEAITKVRDCHDTFYIYKLVGIIKPSITTKTVIFEKD